LHGLDFVVNRGEVVTLLGRNGAGRTTTLRAISVSQASAAVRSW
jgi:branched-chain amino acid transport system ATP-binding protein